MGLSVELEAKLDPSAPLVNLDGSIALSLSEMDAINIPDLSAEFTIATDNNGNIELSLITQGVQQVLTNLNPIVAELSGPIDLQAISRIVELAEQIKQIDLLNCIESLQVDFADGLAGNEDILSKLTSFSEILEGKVDLQSIKQLIEGLISLTGTDLSLDKFNTQDLIPALHAVSSLINKLMRLNALLNGGEKLSELISTQLDQERINNSILFIERQLGVRSEQALAAFLADLDINNDTQVSMAKRSISNVRNAVNGLHDSIAEGMAFGEATLVQLNPSDLKVSVQNASLDLGSLDLAPLERLVAKFAEHLEPLFTADFGQAPVDSLDGWLTLLEGKTTDLAAGIDAYDMQSLMSPVTEGLEAILEIPSSLNEALQALKLELQGSLNSIREAIENVPVESLVNTIRQVLEPIANALAFISDLIANIESILQGALTSLQAALSTAEGAVDAVKDELESLFQTVKTYVDSLNLQDLIGDLAQQIQTFAQVLNQADMSPYFDTVRDVIGTTSGIVEKVPFNLLPDSMEQEVVDLVKPVKELDVDAFENDVKNLLQIGDDGSFELRPELEAALSDIQAKYDEVLGVIEQGNPQHLASVINAQLENIKVKMTELTPTLALEPIQEAIDSVKETLSDFDIDEALKPLSDGFDDVLAKVDEFKPSVLLEDLEASLAESRQAIFEELQLDKWQGEITALRDQLLGLLEPLEATKLEPLLQTAIDEIKSKSAELPAQELAYLIGNFVNSLVNGKGENNQVSAESFVLILEWMDNEQGSQQLVGLANNASTYIDAAYDACSQIDLIAIITRLQPQVAALRSALNTLPDSPVKTELLSCLADIDVEKPLSQFTLLQQRYLAALREASRDFTELANEGLSEVDIAVAQLKVVFHPLSFAKSLFQKILSLLGISDLNSGIQGFVNEVFNVATPARLAGILSPLLNSVKGRVGDILDGFIEPILDGIDELKSLEQQLSLQSLIVELDSIHSATKDQISLLHPSALLGDTMDAFTQTQSDVVNFDPLAAIKSAIESIQSSSVRILDKLDAEKILATPIDIFEDLLSSLELIDLQELLKPILEVLDNLSKKVSEGLEGTTDSFKQLQEALPDQIGSTTITFTASGSN